MQKFLVNLSKRIDAVKLVRGILAPKGELQDGDIVLGVLPHDLRRFYVVLYKLAVEQRKKCHEAGERFRKIARSRSDIKLKDRIFQSRHELSHRRLRLVTDLFWHGIAETFPLTTTTPDGLVQLRKNWRVVISRQEQPPSDSEIQQLFMDIGIAASRLIYRP